MAISSYNIRVGRKRLFDSLLFFQHRKISQMLKDLVKTYDAPTKRIIEIGAGTNAQDHRRLFVKAEFIATDLEKHEGIDKIVNVIDFGSLENNYYDLILCLNVLEHIADPHRAVDEMHKGLRTGGVLFLVTPFLFPIHDPPYDFYRYTEYGLTKMLNCFSRVAIEKIFIFPKVSLLDRFVLYYVVRAVR
jgi:SAM-dependent methyltransferase